jgi:hypothetical protein
MLQTGDYVVLRAEGAGTRHPLGLLRSEHREVQRFTDLRCGIEPWGADHPPSVSECVFEVYACVNHETYSAAHNGHDLMEHAVADSIVHYGQHIQLLHVKSSQMLHVDVRSRAQEDFSMQVGLQKTTLGPGDQYDERLGDDSESFLNAWFCVEPPLQSQQAGDAVKLGDSVLLCNRRWKRYLNARCDELVQEVSASFHQAHEAARFTIIPFSRQTNDPFTRTTVRGGSLVRLFHSESRCFLVNEEINDPARSSAKKEQQPLAPPPNSSAVSSAGPDLLEKTPICWNCGKRPHPPHYASNCPEPSQHATDHHAVAEVWLRPAQRVDLDPTDNVTESGDHLHGLAPDLSGAAAAASAAAASPTTAPLHMLTNPGSMSVWRLERPEIHWGGGPLESGGTYRIRHVPSGRLLCVRRKLVDAAGGGAGGAGGAGGVGAAGAVGSAAGAVGSIPNQVVRADLVCLKAEDCLAGGSGGMGLDGADPVPLVDPVLTELLRHWSEHGEGDRGGGSSEDEDEDEDEDEGRRHWKMLSKTMAMSAKNGSGEHLHWKNGSGAAAGVGSGIVWCHDDTLFRLVMSDVATPMAQKSVDRSTASLNSERQGRRQGGDAMDGRDGHQQADHELAYSDAEEKEGKPKIKKGMAMGNIVMASMQARTQSTKDTRFSTTPQDQQRPRKETRKHRAPPTPHPAVVAPAEVSNGSFVNGPEISAGGRPLGGGSFIRVQHVATGLWLQSVADKPDGKAGFDGGAGGAGGARGRSSKANSTSSFTNSNDGAASPWRLVALSETVKETDYLQLQAVHPDEEDRIDFILGARQCLQRRFRRIRRVLASGKELKIEHGELIVDVVQYSAVV